MIQSVSRILLGSKDMRGTNRFVLPQVCWLCAVHGVEITYCDRIWALKLPLPAR